MRDTIDQLTQKLWDEVLTGDDVRELNSLLADESCRQRFVDLHKLHWALAESERSSCEAKPTAGAYAKVHERLLGPTDAAVTGKQDAWGRLGRTGRAWFGDLSHGPAALASIAALVIAAATIGLVRFGLKSESSSPRNAGDRVVIVESADTPREGVRQRSKGPSERFAARIVAFSADAEWNREDAGKDFLLRLLVGDKLDLSQGVARLEFVSGAVAVVTAPAKVEIVGPEEVLLHRGKLTGRTGEGTFAVSTPSAYVVDVGTAFGVLVDEDKTDVVVFEGEVDVLPDANHPDPVRLTSGMSIRANRAGLAAPRRGDNPEWMDRNFRGERPGALGPRELSLIDIVCGSAPGEYRMAGSIDPNTGLWSSLPWSESKGVRERLETENVLPVEDNPWVHGIFVPDSRRDVFEVDLEGGSVRAPEMIGGAWGPVWARRRIDRELDPLTRSVNGDIEGFWGAGTKAALLDRSRWVRDGIVGLHANVGFTVDLTAIRRAYQAAPVGVGGVLAHLEKSHDSQPFQPQAQASFSLFVDGELRYERRRFCRKDGDALFGADLRPGDRFLSLVVTDAGDGPIFDRVVLLDPVIELASVTSN